MIDNDETMVQPEARPRQESSITAHSTQHSDLDQNILSPMDMERRRNFSINARTGFGANNNSLSDAARSRGVSGISGDLLMPATLPNHNASQSSSNDAASQ